MESMLGAGVAAGEGHSSLSCNKKVLGKNY